MSASLAIGEIYGPSKDGLPITPFHRGLTGVRIPTKPATNSNRKPATDSDLKPAGIPI